MDNEILDFKFNGGIGAIVCGKCRTILKQGAQIADEEWAHARGEIILPAQYCKPGCQERNFSKYLHKNNG